MPRDSSITWPGWKNRLRARLVTGRFKYIYEMRYLLLLLILHVSNVFAQAHDSYGTVLAEQLNQYCDLHNRCPQAVDQNSRHVARTGKAGPRGLRGHPGPPGIVNYTAVKEAIKDEIREIAIEERITELTTRLSSLEKTVSRNSRKNCVGVDKSDAKIQNSTGGVFEIFGMHTDVYCDLATDGGGWMVFQRRIDGSENFQRNWADYVAGFGRPEGEFWLGLEKLHRITTRDSHDMRVDLEDWEGNKYYALYTTFSIGDAASKYTLNVGGYSGTAGDSMEYHNGHRFYTSDQDNGNSCVSRFKGGWWYNNCFYSNLNGIYLNQWKYTAANSHGLEWWTVMRSHNYSFKFAEMKIRPKN